MNRQLRLVQLLSSCAVALALGGNALAAYNPALGVESTSYALGSSRGDVNIFLAQQENDDATGVITIYAPRGYSVTLGQRPGTKIGDLAGIFKVGALGRQEITGTVNTRDPAQYVNNLCSPGVHEAVWLLESSLAGNPLQIPMYIDRIRTGPEAARASLRMRVCLASPYVPPPQGAAGGVSLIGAFFSVRGVFRNPRTRGRYAWNALFVPYTPGTATPNPRNAAQSTVYTRLGARLLVTVKPVERKRRFVRLTGCLAREGVDVRGVRVTFRVGLSVRRGRRVTTITRGIRQVRMNARGCATLLVVPRVRAVERRTVRVKFFYAIALLPRRNVTLSLGCAPALSVAPGAPNAHCTSATFARTIVESRAVPAPQR